MLYMFDFPSFTGAEVGSKGEGGDCAQPPMEQKDPETIPIVRRRDKRSRQHAVPEVKKTVNLWHDLIGDQGQSKITCTRACLLPAVWP